MRLFKFREEAGGSLALVVDPEGRALPRDGRVWEAIGWVGDHEIADLGPEPADIRRGVRDEGVYVWG